MFKGGHCGHWMWTGQTKKTENRWFFKNSNQIFQTLDRSSFWLVTLLKDSSSKAVIEIIEMILRETKIVWVSGRFALSRFQVTECKITVNIIICWKSRGNKFWFELAQVWVSKGSSYGESTITTVYQNIQDSYTFWCSTIQLHDHVFEKGNLKINSIKETFCRKLKIKLKWQKEFKKSISVSKL